jgi:hypothetical protein
VTIADAKKMLRKLEDDILHLIQNFEDETGCIIRDIDFNRYDVYFMGKCEKRLMNVKCDCTFVSYDDESE